MLCCKPLIDLGKDSIVETVLVQAELEPQPKDYHLGALFL